MIDDIFVFDNVIHLYDMSTANIRTDRADARPARDSVLKVISALRWPEEAIHVDPNFDWGRRWGVEDMYDLVFGGSPTDMAMAQVVPMFDRVRDWYAPVQTQHAMAKAYPDRVLFCGGVDPKYRGMEDALGENDYQGNELGHG